MKLLIIAATVPLLTLTACQDFVEQRANEQMAHIKGQVAQEAVNQYNMVEKTGTKIDKCVQAGMVAAAYLQAEDQSNYGHWKTTEMLDCARAGIPPK